MDDLAEKLALLKIAPEVTNLLLQIRDEVEGAYKDRIAEYQRSIENWKSLVERLTNSVNHMDRLLDFAEADKQALANRCKLQEYNCGDANCETHHAECVKDGECWHWDKTCLRHATARVEMLEVAIRKYLAAGGHDLCWENRRDLAQVLADPSVNDLLPVLVTREEFEAGCKKYQDELYGRTPP